MEKQILKLMEFKPPPIEVLNFQKKLIKQRNKLLNMKTLITKESLLKFGFKLSKSPFDHYEKILSETIDPEGEDKELIALVVTHRRNITEMGLITPDGIIFLNADLEQLAIIEKCVTGYESDC